MPQCVCECECATGVDFMKIFAPAPPWILPLLHCGESPLLSVQSVCHLISFTWCHLVFISLTGLTWCPGFEHPSPLLHPLFVLFDYSSPVLISCVPAWSLVSVSSLNSFLFSLLCHHLLPVSLSLCCITLSRLMDVQSADISSH